MTDNYKPDPGENFASDVHRRVLAHLSLPGEKFGFEVEPLTNRLAQDGGTPDLTAPEVEKVLGELEAEGYAVAHGSVWQQTTAGSELLAGPIANEPEPGASVVGPAMVDINPTPFGKKEA